MFVVELSQPCVDGCCLIGCRYFRARDCHVSMPRIRFVNYLARANRQLISNVHLDGLIIQVIGTAIISSYCEGIEADMERSCPIFYLIVVSGCSASSYNLL